MRYSYEFKRKCVELYRQSVGLQHIYLIYLPHCWFVKHMLHRA